MSVKDTTPDSLPEMLVPGRDAAEMEGWCAEEPELAKIDGCVGPVGVTAV